MTVIGGPDQLDQYLMRYPEALFEQTPEQAVVNPANAELLPEHVLSAAQETWLSPDDRNHFGETFPSVVATLEDQGLLERRQTRDGIRWTYDGGDSPQHEMSLRSIDDREITLIDHGRDERLGSLDFADALRDVHPGAIYHHQGRTFEVADLQLDADRALLASTQTTGYTQALREKRITIENSLRSKPLAMSEACEVSLAEITVREQIDSYLEYASATDEEGTKQFLDEPLPETQLSTQALVIPIPPAIERAVAVQSSDERGILSGLHALEHALISLFPLELLCDRGDIGGLSIRDHPETGRSTIFVHDAHPGGVGLARGGYDRLDELLAETHALVASCPCAAGCPSCVHSPQCGNANQHLDKQLALALLERLGVS